MPVLAVRREGSVRRPAERVRVTEIFLSIQGEAAQVGWPTVFVRLTGCPLRCRWCDTGYAFAGGQALDIDDALQRVAAFGVRHVCVTGGEPLAQAGCLPLLQELCDCGFAVSLETSGALDIREVDPRVAVVMDLKTPGSGETERNRIDNLAVLKRGDQVKFVLAGRADFDWALDLLRRHPLPEGVEILFSPVHGELEPRLLADWIVAVRAPVRFQLQLHKLLWGDVPGR
jgi:7-carboxy-7-deazaguanine synthase